MPKRPGVFRYKGDSKKHLVTDPYRYTAEKTIPEVYGDDTIILPPHVFYCAFRPAKKGELFIPTTAAFPEDDRNDVPRDVFMAVWDGEPDQPRIIVTPRQP